MANIFLELTELGVRSSELGVREFQIAGGLIR